jgi:glycosyltransferase involved in cell wall biosynthesis
VGAWPFKFDYTTSPPAMAIAEALSVGLPTVATDVGCVRAVVEPDVNGLTVPPGDAPALATAILRLLTDRDHWQRLATAGPVTTRQLSWSRAAEVTDTAYRTALSASAS